MDQNNTGVPCRRPFCSRTIVTTLLALSLASPAVSWSQDVLRQAKSDVAVLSSRKMHGRGYVFGGLERAGEYLAGRFREIGIHSIGETYFQTFTMMVNTFDGAPRLTIGHDSLILGEDFLPYATSGSGAVENATDIVFVGPGLVIPSRGINDYAGVSRTSSVIVIDDEIPDSLRRATPTLRDLFTRRARIDLAMMHRPSAIIFLVSRVTFGDPNERDSVPIVDVLKEKMPRHPTSLSFEVRSSYAPHVSRNVVGMIPGTERTDSTVILCAHYDHLGAFTDSLFFPGANDNASGTAMLLALARFFVVHPVRTSLIVLATSGEEEGLVGSRFYADHPLDNLQKTCYVLNFDVVASGDGGIMVVGGEDYPAAFSRMSAICDSLHVHPLWKRPSVPNSDHYSFFRKGVESFFFYTLNGKQPYHRFDDVAATLDWVPFVHVFDLATAFIQKTEGSLQFR
jgi:aminopeptidase YwaD